MKVMITGGSGVLGFKAGEHFSRSKNSTTLITYNKHQASIQNTSSLQLDVADAHAVSDAVSSFKPDLIWHCAGLTNVDLCETDRSLAGTQNIGATRNVAQAAADNNAFLIFISTSYVFDGKDGVALPEDSPYCPSTYYGHTKVEGEKIIRSLLPNRHLILRADQIYCWNLPFQKKNTVTRLLELLSGGKTAREITDWLNAPTYVPNFIDVAEALRARGKSGTYNLTGTDFLSRYEWGLCVAKVFGFDPNLIRPVSSSTLNLPARRPNVRLDCSKAARDSGIEILGVEKGMLHMKENKPI